MTNIPTTHEETRTIEQGTLFVSGMDKVAAIEATRNLEPRDLIEFWSGFQSSSEIPFPAAATHRAADDLAAVLAGSKPATILVLTEQEPDPLFDKLCEVAELDGYFDRLTYNEVVGDTGRTVCIFGKKDNVNTLSRRYQWQGGETRKVDDTFHRAVGEALGYAPEAIDDFVSRLSQTKS